MTVILVLSEVFRYVKINCHDDGMPSQLKVVEAFTSFIEVEVSSAIGSHKLIRNSIQQKRLDIKITAADKDMVMLQ